MDTATLSETSAKEGGIVRGNAHDKSGLTIRPTHAEVVRFVNESYIVVCSSHNGTTVKWTSPKGVVAPETRGRVHTERREGLAKGAQALIFEHIHLVDRGDWVCSQVAEAGSHNKTFKMMVNEPISFVETPPSQMAREDGDFTIKCLAKGDPAPSVSWYFNGHPITVPSDKFKKLDQGLSIKNVTIDDRGEYTCRAFQVSSSASSMQEQVIQVNIQHKPVAVKKLPHHAKAEEAYGYVSGTVNLTCEARAEPAANFTWHRNGKPVAKSSGRIFEDTHMTVLEVPIPDRSAFGDYMCKARNFMGTMERIITLIEGQRPEPPSEVSLKGVNSDFFDIEIKAPRQYTGPSTLAPHPDNLPIIGYRFQYMVLPNSIKAETSKTTPKELTSNDVMDTTSPATELTEDIAEDLWINATVLDMGVAEGATYILTGLHHNTPYVIRVMSRNAAGLSVPSPPLRCQTHRLQPYDVSSSASRQSPPSLTAAILSAAVILAAAIFHKPQIPAQTERRDSIFNFNRPEAPLAFSTIDKSESLNRC